MKAIVYFVCILLTIVTLNATGATKQKGKKKPAKRALTTLPVASPYVIAIGYPTIDGALSAVKQSGFTPKANAKPFGWQQRSGSWYVANEPAELNKQTNLEWAFTQPSHYAHPSVIKRMIDIGSTDHVYVDMAFRCGDLNTANCDRLLAEFKEVNLLIRKVYQKKYIKAGEGIAVWDGADSLD